MPTIEVAVVNASTVVDDAALRRLLPALQRQVSEDFAPAWGVDATLEAVPRGKRPPAGRWWLALLDDADQAGALGYHDLTDHGLPLGKVFARTARQLGCAWTVTASHELLEMLADPDVNLTVFREAHGKGTLYAYEVCDACEDDRFGYEVGGVRVSDFVYPAWFEDFRAPRSTVFDHGRHIARPFELLRGGYIGVFDVAAGTGWHQLTKETGPLAALARPRVGSRRERRRTPRDSWVRSAPSSHQGGMAGARRRCSSWG